MEVDFIWMIFKCWFGHLSLSLEFEEDPISGFRDIAVSKVSLVAGGLDYDNHTTLRPIL